MVPFILRETIKQGMLWGKDTSSQPLPKGLQSFTAEADPNLTGNILLYRAIRKIQGQDLITPVKSNCSHFSFVSCSRFYWRFLAAKWKQLSTNSDQSELKIIHANGNVDIKDFVYKLGAIFFFFFYWVWCLCMLN